MELQSHAGENHTPKRVRAREDQYNEHDKTPTATPQRSTPQRASRSPYHSLTRRIASRPGRMAKFKEGSMRDLRSQKPPSMFLRSMNPESCTRPSDATFDDLMDDYLDDEVEEPLPPRPRTAMSFRSRHRPTTSRSTVQMTQQSGLTHHANTSISASSVSTEKESVTIKEPSGMARFGKSLAAAFRPKAWAKSKSTTQLDRDESREAAIEEAAARAREESLAKAQEAFEELKRSGAINNFTKTFVRPHVAFKEDDASLRDSGVAFEPEPARHQNNHNDDESDDESDATIVELDTERDDRSLRQRSSFHVRRPSLNSLKHMPSGRSLTHKRSRSLDTKPNPDVLDGFRTKPESSHVEPSTKSLKKRKKLKKRVSTLEAQLQAAKQKLEDIEPVPVRESSPEPTTAPHIDEEVSKPQPAMNTRKSLKIPKRMKSGFMPGALPSVPSERLLLKPNDADDKSTWSFKCAGRPDVKPVYSGTETVLEEVSECVAAAQEPSVAAKVPARSDQAAGPRRGRSFYHDEHGTAILGTKSLDIQRPATAIDLVSKYNVSRSSFDKENRSFADRMKMWEGLSTGKSAEPEGIQSRPMHRKVQSMTTENPRRSSRVPASNSAVKLAGGRSFLEEASSDEDDRKSRRELARREMPPAISPRRTRNVLSKLSPRSPKGKGRKTAGKVGSPGKRGDVAAEFEWPEDCF